MKLNKPWKIIIGLVTLWVALYPFITMIGMFGLMPFFILLEENGNSSELPIFFGGFMLFMLVIVFSSFLQIAASAFYIAHVIKNKNGLDILRIIFGIGSYYLPYFALPVYYLIYILPDTPPEWALENSSVEG